MTVDSFDAVLFHSPFGKLVQKSLARLVFNDFLQADDATVAEKFAGLEELRSVLSPSVSVRRSTRINACQFGD